MLHLTLFGSPRIETDDGVPVTGRAAQRHRLALLALLACAGDRGATRERLTAVLWPESTHARARNLLKVSVYVLRQQLGQEALLSEGEELRLNPAHVETDVVAFGRALDRGDGEAALRLYRGPFLDEFFLERAPEFERWAARERDRFAAAYGRALESVAERAEAGGDPARAVELWKARAAQDPYDSRVTLRLMRALASGGNPAGALQQAAAHQRLLRQDLGLSVGPELATLASQIRTDTRHRIDGRPAPAAGSAPSPDGRSRRPNRFRLQTFDGLVLRGPVGTTSGEDPSAALPLALLAVLAAAGEEGVATDRLLLLFWPDAPHRAARGSLDRVLETIRSWSADPLIVGRDPVRLNAAVVGSDITDFEAALAAGDFDTAVRLHAGPFLHRFPIDASSELDAWVTEQRSRLAERHDAALEQVAVPAGEDPGSSDGALPQWGDGGSRRNGLRLRSVLLGSAAAVAAVLILWPRTSVPSLAVLPIHNVGGDPRQGPLSDALTEELISRLGREPDRLRVISSTSVFRFRESRTDVRAIADSLGVSTLLEATLLPVESRFRLALRLVDGRDGSVRWTRSYERDQRDVLSGLDSIAGSVADALEVSFSIPARAGAISSDTPVSDRRLAAIDLYLQGQRDVLFRTEKGREEARELFRRAVDVDPTYAPAHAMRAHMLAEWDNTGRFRRDSIAAAERSARTAIALDPRFAGGYAALGHALMLDYRFAEAEDQLERAIALDPTRSRSREFLIWLYVFLDRPALVLEQARLAVRHDPYSSTAIAELARAWLLNGRCDRALELIDRLRSLQPPPARATGIDAQCRAQRGSLEEAVEVLRPLVAGNAVQGEPYLAFMLGRAGRIEEARQVRDRLLEMARRNGGDAYGVAIVHAGLGELDAAFDWLDRAVDDRSLRFEIMEPAFRVLHRDPRFDRLRARLGVPEPD